MVMLKREQEHNEVSEAYRGSEGEVREQNIKRKHKSYGLRTLFASEVCRG